MAKPKWSGSTTDPYGQKSTSRETAGDWPAFTDESRFPGILFWMAMGAGALLAAVGLGWLILWVLS